MLVNSPREELCREEERDKIENAARRGGQKRNSDMQGRKVPVILPTGQQGEGTEVQVEQSE